MAIEVSDDTAISALDDYKPSTITRLMATDGQQIGEFATERRVVIRYEDIAPVLRQAIIASEDAEFESHFGISVSRLIVTAIRDLGTGHRMRGASTITQQVARMLFLQDYMRGGVFARSGTVGLERKIKEWLISFQLEKRYTKNEILAFYANHVPLDHGAYGVEAASRMYFDKPAKDLSLEEAASIVAIIPTPSRLSPFRNPDQNINRRNNYVLRRMAEEATGLPAEVFRKVSADTKFMLDCGQTTASRGTVLAGNSIAEAGKQLKTALDSGKTLADLVGETFIGEWKCTYTSKLGYDIDKPGGPKTHLTYGFATQVAILDDEHSVTARDD